MAGFYFSLRRVEIRIPCWHLMMRRGYAPSSFFHLAAYNRFWQDGFGIFLFFVFFFRLLLFSTWCWLKIFYFFCCLLGNMCCSCWHKKHFYYLCAIISNYRYSYLLSNKCIRRITTDGRDFYEPDTWETVLWESSYFFVLWTRCSRLASMNIDDTWSCHSIVTTGVVVCLQLKRI